MTKDKFDEICDNYVKQSLLEIFSKKEQWKSYYSEESYIDYLAQKGFNPPPKLICENEKMSYFGYAILQILQTSLKMKDGTRLEQSVFLISDIFFHIERNSRDNFNLLK